MPGSDALLRALSLFLKCSLLSSQSLGSRHLMEKVDTLCARVAIRIWPSSTLKGIIVPILVSTETGARNRLGIITLRNSFLTPFRPDEVAQGPTAQVQTGTYRK